METIALATLLIPFIGALLTACLPQRYAPWLCTGVALLATLGTVQLAWLFYLSGMEPTTLSLVQYGDVALFLASSSIASAR